VRRESIELGERKGAEWFCKAGHENAPGLKKEESHDGRIGVRSAKRDGGHEGGQEFWRARSVSIVSEAKRRETEFQES